MDKHNKLSTQLLSNGYVKSSDNEWNRITTAGHYTLERHGETYTLKWCVILPATLKTLSDVVFGMNVDDTLNYISYFS